jgi:DNA-binding ferritin-like protein (Dps family)
MSTTFAAIPTAAPKRKRRDITNSEAAAMLDWFEDAFGESVDELDDITNDDVADMCDSLYSGGVAQFLKDGAV